MPGTMLGHLPSWSMRVRMARPPAMVKSRNVKRKGATKKGAGAFLRSVEGVDQGCLPIHVVSRRRSMESSRPGMSNGRCPMGNVQCAMSKDADAPIADGSSAGVRQ